MKGYPASIRLALLAFSAVVLALPCHALPGAANPRVLVFFGCGGVVHGSIPYINQIWIRLAAENGIDIDTSSDVKVFTKDNLARYKAVLWNNTTHPGTILDSAKRSAWLAYAKTGGYVGMHAAGDVSETWPDYVLYMGGTNSQHSNTTQATLNLEPGPEAALHPIRVDAAWPVSLQLTDEWYSWRINPRTVPGIKILYTLDEKTFTPGIAMGNDHPIVWTREFSEGGRMVYMGMGHNIDLFKPVPDKGYAIMEKLMRAALLWAVKRNSTALIPVRPGKTGTPGRVSRETQPSRIRFRDTRSPFDSYLDVSGRWSGILQAR
ncbi:MAG: glycosyl hydrolase [Fibrobacteres bacterium]|nr:glycosyl hydrolase [Fibrobacterota bacterium]